MIVNTPGTAIKNSGCEEGNDGKLGEGKQNVKAESVSAFDLIVKMRQQPGNEFDLREYSNGIKVFSAVFFQGYCGDEDARFKKLETSLNLDG